jgi:hypothetical protein
MISVYSRKRSKKMIRVCNIFFILTIIALSFTWGCAGKHSARESALHQNWGQSVELINYSQVLRPEAGGLQPVQGLPGGNAEHVNKQYEKTFSQGPDDFQSTTQMIKNR